MVMPFQASSTQDVAAAATLDGRKVLVRKVQFNMPVPGLGNQGYAVDIVDGSGHGVQSLGFANEQEAMDFLSSTQSKPYTVVDAMGNQVQESRTGLGIPQGMIVQYQKQATPPIAPTVASVVPPNASQYPDAAAAMNAPSDANRRMVVGSEQSFQNAPFQGTQSTPVSSNNVNQVSGTVEQQTVQTPTGQSVSQPVEQQSGSNAGNAANYEDASL